MKLKIFIILIGIVNITSFNVRGQLVETKIHPNWGPKILNICTDDFSQFMGYRANLYGNLSHKDHKSFTQTPSHINVEGWSDTLNDKMVYQLSASNTGEYDIAILYKNPDLPVGIEVEVSANGTTTTLVPTSAEAAVPESHMNIRYTKKWCKQSILLHKGTNEVTIRLSKITTSAKGFSFRSIEVVESKLHTKLRIEAKEMQADISWMQKGKYGLFVHYSPLNWSWKTKEIAAANWEQHINEFDVKVFGDAVEKTGAAWVLFTVFHGLAYFPGPLDALDKLLPGRTTKRDLIGEIADDLADRGISLMLYWHSAAAQTPVMSDFKEAIGFYMADKQIYNNNLIKIVEEVSKKYGKRLASPCYYFDTGLQVLYHLEFPWRKFIKAIRKGNPDAIIGISHQYGPSPTIFGDVDQTDGRDYLVPAPLREWYEVNGPYEGLVPAWGLRVERPGWLYTPEKGVDFAKSTLVHSAKEYIHFINEMSSAGIPVTFGVIVSADVNAKYNVFDPKVISAFEKIKKAVGERSSNDH